MIQKTPMIPPSNPPASERRTELPAGHKKAENFRAFSCPVILEEDAVLTVRHGTKIRVDIYRPKTEKKVPAIVSWGPYGKSGKGKSQ
jgi:Predicted acyl esterases